jgi:hypothetical protein
METANAINDFSMQKGFLLEKLSIIFKETIS